MTETPPQPPPSYVNNNNEINEEEEEEEDQPSPSSHILSPSSSVHHLLSCHFDDQSLPTLLLLLKIFANLLSSSDVKYRKVKVGTKVFQNKIGRIEGAEQVMMVSCETDEMVSHDGKL